MARERKKTYQQEKETGDTLGKLGEGVCGNSMSKGKDMIGTEIERKTKTLAVIEGEIVLKYTDETNKQTQLA